jgi:hypothetical protein
MKFRVSEDGVEQEFQCMDSLVGYLTRQRAIGVAMATRAINKAMGGKAGMLFVYKKTLMVEMI